MWSFVKKLVGGSNVIGKGMDLVDEAFHTDQEKIDSQIKLAKAYGQNSKASSKARRVMMYLFCVPFMGAFVLGFWFVLTGQTSEVNNMIRYVNLWNLPALVGAILFFYFGRQAYAESQANNRIGKMTMLKKEENREGKKMSGYYEKLAEQLEDHEDLRLKPYRCTAGKLTIGIGRNLEDKGVTRKEAEYLLMSDIESVEGQLDSKLPWWRSKPENVRLVLTDMCFNLGIDSFMQFEKFLDAVKRDDMETAKVEMMDSRWAEQVGRRAENLRAMM